MKIILLLSILVCVVHSLPMWGHQGHEITAGIAEQLMSSDALNKVNKILQGQSMIEVASWADQIKHEPGWGWSGDLHYINTPDWACDYVPSRDCANNICVQGAITNYTRRVQSDTGDNQNVDMKFLIHFVGDIHQPLHVGFGSDRGGNSIEGTFNGYRDNLHSIWDTWIIEERMKNNFNGDQTAYMNYLVKQINGPWAQNATEWSKCSQDECATEWGNGSANLACKYAYTDSNGKHIENGFDLGEPYYDFSSPIVDEQLAKGGVRLAYVLDTLFGKSDKALPSNV